MLAFTNWLHPENQKETIGLCEKGITVYYLIFKQGISANTLHRMKHGEAICAKTINVFCEILNCTVSDIIEYVPDD